MPLQASGRIKLSEIAAQFGGSGPHKMSEYYKGGSIVKNTSINSDLPSNGRIQLTDFYSKANPRITVLKKQINGQNGVTFSLDTTERGDNTNIATVYAFTDNNVHRTPPNPYLHQGGNNIPEQFSILVNSDRSSDGQVCRIKTYRPGNMSGTITQSVSNDDGTCAFYIIQIDNAANFNEAVDYHRRPTASFPIDGGHSKDCILDCTSPGRFVVMGFSTYVDPPDISDIENTDDTNINRGVSQAAVGYATNATGTTNFKAVGNTGRAVIGAAFAY